MSILSQGVKKAASFSGARALAWFVLGIMLVLTLAPVWMVVKTALTGPHDLYTQSSDFFLKNPTLINFERVLGLLSTEEAIAAGGSGAEISILNHYCPVKLKKCESRLSIGAG